MLFKDYVKAYVDFCEEEILREIALAKRRYQRKEKKHKWECTLNERVASGIDVEKIDLTIGDYDVKLEAFLPLEETVEDDDIAKYMKLLSNRERKVVSLRLDEDKSVKQINIYFGFTRNGTSSEIYQRAIKKIRNNLKDEKGE